jgi:MFS family permease
MTLVRIIALTVLTHTAFGAARVTGSLYALSNKASAFTVGVMMALFALLPMLLAVRAGRWLDAVGPRRPMLLGTSLMGAGIVLPALFPYAVADVGPLLVAAALIGTGFLYLQMTLQHLVGEQAAPERRAEAFSYLALGFSTSGLIAPVASGVLIDTVGHRATFAVFFGVMLAAVVLLVTQRHLLADREGEVAGDPERPLFDLFRHREVRNILIASGLVSMSWDLQTFMVPVYGTRIGLSASGIGLVLGSFAAATFAIRLAMPWLARSFREWQVLMFTLATGATAFALIPFFDTLAPLMACAFLLGLGLGAAQPNVMSLIHARTPAGRVGEALGLRTTVMNGSHVVLPLVFGAFGAVVGAGAAFWTMAALLAGGAAVLRRRERAPRGPA